jgi:hypothetical protein
MMSKLKIWLASKRSSPGPRAAPRRDPPCLDMMQETKDDAIPKDDAVLSKEEYEMFERQALGRAKWEVQRKYISPSNVDLHHGQAIIFGLVDRKLDRILRTVDPAKTEQNIAASTDRIAALGEKTATDMAKSAERVAGIEMQVASAAEIGAAAQPVLAALERLEARMAALEARQAASGCCVVS